MESFVSYMQKVMVLLCSAMLLGIVACASSSKVFSISCEDRSVEIYVDDVYLGRDLVQVTMPASTTEFDISCRIGGEEIYKKRVYARGRKGWLVEVQMPKNYKYSTNKKY